MEIVFQLTYEGLHKCLIHLCVIILHLSTKYLLDICLLRLNIRVEPERDCICNVLNLSNKVKNHKELTEYLFAPYATRGFLHSFECKEFISFGNNIGWAQEGGLW